MDSKKIIHSGTVLGVEGSLVKVGFQSQGACGGCAARAKCGMVDSSTREVMAQAAAGVEYKIGDKVEVAITQQMGIKSVVIAYIIPLIILIGILVVATTFGVNEGVSALISLGGVAIYYVGVYIFRLKLDKQIKFTIEK